ncbi:MAG TPA: NAD(P)/FAD-dependent oxidoreductase [Sphingomicrobium sp.]|nr:NAD(P)/FAD-dependent oxidoreductase [Sphingomicrobium sp.]
MARGDTDSDHVDVLIVGAGISGVDAAYRLKTRCKDRSFLILEARERVGGTWDLFRYPGVRSDSDIFTLGFPFRPWPSDKSIVEGSAIRDYVEDTAREFGIFENIRFGHRVVSASWSSAEARWSIEVKHKGEMSRFTCSFLFACSGYYDYDAGYRPEWEGEPDFQGQIVHPQFWPEDLDLRGKTVAVIGSGATAVTLVPALAETAAHVTMVQRTPSYIVSRPANDIVARFLHRWLPRKAAHKAIRWKNVLLTIFMYSRARKQPERVASWIRDMIRKELPDDYPVDRDFTPPYKPWDQRLCLVPDGDLFAAMRLGKVTLATGAVERFIPVGLRLENGQAVAADVVVTATGLIVKLFGGIDLEVDGARVIPADRLIYKGMMLSGVPNFFLSFGYTNASWTLRSDVTARAVARILNHMRRHGFGVCTPREPPGIDRQPVITFSSGYVQRALPFLPKQGSRRPWAIPQNYVKDRLAMRLSPIDADLEFSRTETAARS